MRAEGKKTAAARFCLIAGNICVMIHSLIEMLVSVSEGKGMLDGFHG